VSFLVVEILLRLAKAGAALVVGGILYIVITVAFGVPGSAELALLAWISGAAFVLLVESSPI
jgi:hypothetical protein